MDYIKEAKKLGFSNAAIMDTQKLVFKPEYRKFCEENQCGCYNVNPACPPECGTVESMKQRVFAYEKALILQRIWTTKWRSLRTINSPNSWPLK